MWFDRFLEALIDGDDEAMEEILAVAAQDRALERRIFFFLLFEWGRNKSSVPSLEKRTSEADLRVIVEGQGCRYEEEEGEVYAVKEPGFAIPVGRSEELRTLSVEDVQGFISRQIQQTITRQMAPYYIGMSFTDGEDERLLNLLPMFMRPSHIEKEQCPQASRLFLTLRFFPKEYLLDLEEALELLMYNLCVIHGYAHGHSLEWVKEKTLIEGEPAQCE